MVRPERRRTLPWLFVVFYVACNTGSLDDETADADVDSAHDTGADSASDTGTSCTDVVCGTHEECRDGICIAVDACSDVVCDNPGEICRDGVCIAGAADEDDDGFPASTDCDDFSAAINPDATETCNGVDDNCNDEIDEGFDRDGDGFTTCGGTEPALADCDDMNASVNPSATDLCNGLDDDCDGTIDEDDPAISTSCGTDVGDCISGLIACIDGELLCQGATGPQSERCDGSDRDCDGDSGCADSDCEQTSCGGANLCFSGVCATPCDVHNDGSVSCSTLCAWDRASCRGAITDGGSTVSCGHSGEPMTCYCEY